MNYISCTNYRIENIDEKQIRVDKGFVLELSDIENKILSFISQEFSNGKRSVEMYIVLQLIENDVVEIKTLHDLYTYKDVNSALNYITLKFLTEPEQVKYNGVNILNYDEFNIYRTTQFENAIKNTDFLQHLKDLLSYGLKRNNDKFRLNVDGYMLLFEQYSRKDYIWLSNWSKNSVATIYGCLYNKEMNTLPIFITYNKDESISDSINYEDYFLDSETFNWISKNNRTLGSSDIKNILDAKENNTLIQLFVKRSDGENTQFYYFGEVDVVEYKQVSMEVDGKQVPVVNFVLKLKNPVRDDLY